MKSKFATVRLLETKMRVPVVPDTTVQRPRLFVQLDGALQQGGLLVAVAPAGFGKTTLVASWLAQRPGSVAAAWLSLDKRDNDLEVFAGYLVAAIRTALPDTYFRISDLLASPAGSTLADIASVLISDLGQLSSPLVLVLDDYHVIHDRAVHELMEMLVVYAPSSVTFVLLARYDPPLPVSRWVLQGKARQIRATDLRFRPAEVEQFFAQNLRMPVSPETLDSLVELAGGWIAQLRLAIVWLERDPEHQSPQEIQNVAMEYLLDELLQHESQQVRQFLLATSVLERLCVPLIEAVLCGDTDPPAEVPSSASELARVLQYVERAGLFLTPLDGAGLWYRYHDLFRELLLRRLTVEVGIEEVHRLRRRAFSWLAHAGLAEEALAQALAAQDREAAAALVEHHILQAVRDYQWQTVRRWLDVVPAAAAASRPAFLLAQGYLYSNAHALDGLRSVIERAQALVEEREAGGHDPAGSVWRGTLELLRSEYALSTNQVEVCRAAAERAIEAAAPASPERALATVNLATAITLAGRGEEARALLAQQLRQLPDDRTPWAFRLRLGAGLSHFRSAQLGEAKQELELTEQLYGAAAEPYNSCWLHYTLGRIEYEWNNLSSAAEHFRAARAHGGNFMRGLDSLLGSALVAQASGEEEEADRFVEEALALARATGSETMVSLALSMRSRLWILRGQVARVSPLHRRPMASEPMALYMPVALPRFTEIARRLALGEEADLREAETLLDEAWMFYERTHTVLVQVQVLSMLALVHRARGAHSRSLAILARAVELGRAGGLIRTFLDLGPDLLGLLPDVAVSPAAKDYLARILAAANPPSRPGPASVPPGADRAEPLTSREVAVLELLAQHLSDKEIARSLSISPLTVRKHTANIFGKLQVHNRRQAAAKARELGISIRSY